MKKYTITIVNDEHGEALECVVEAENKREALSKGFRRLSICDHLLSREGMPVRVYIDKGAWVKKRRPKKHD